MTHLCRVLFQIFNNETEYKIGFLADMFYVTVKFSRRKTETPMLFMETLHNGERIDK